VNERPDSWVEEREWRRERRVWMWGGAAMGEWEGMLGWERGGGAEGAGEGIFGVSGMCCV
jgi:hypothetical protein